MPCLCHDVFIASAIHRLCSALCFLQTLGLQVAEEAVSKILPVAGCHQYKGHASRNGLLFFRSFYETSSFKVYEQRWFF